MELQLLKTFLPKSGMVIFRGEWNVLVTMPALRNWQIWHQARQWETLSLCRKAWTFYLQTSGLEDT